mgnify:CR=1 FL=1
MILILVNYRIRGKRRYFTIYVVKKELQRGAGRLLLADYGRPCLLPGASVEGQCLYSATTPVHQSRKFPIFPVSELRAGLGMGIKWGFMELSPGFVNNPFREYLEWPVAQLYWFRKNQAEVLGSRFAVRPRRDQTALLKLCTDI